MRGAKLIWPAVAAIGGVPLVLAATSPLLAWREPVYIVAGFAGVLCLTVLLVQPLLVRSRGAGRAAHRWGGAILVGLALAHVVGLWITSPPDVVDALLFRSPTSFSVFGVVAMWLVFGVAALAVLRRRVPPRLWRLGHSAAVGLIALATVAHALLIEGTMEPISKTVISTAVLALSAWAIWDVWAPVLRRWWSGR